LKFANKLVSGSIYSTSFYYTTGNTISTVYLQDNITTSTTSTLDLLDFYTSKTIELNVGTVNYTSGQVSIPSLNPAGFVENSTDIRIYSRIQEMDIESTRDIVLVIDDSALDTAVKRSSGLTVSASN
jgi:hypothetical protein